MELVMETPAPAPETADEQRRRTIGIAADPSTDTHEPDGDGGSTEYGDGPPRPPQPPRRPTSWGRENKGGNLKYIACYLLVFVLLLIVNTLAFWGLRLQSERHGWV